jgi:hypothetical protein
MDRDPAAVAAFVAGWVPGLIDAEHYTPSPYVPPPPPLPSRIGPMPRRKTPPNET